MRVMMVSKRNTKLEGIRQELPEPHTSAEVGALVFCFGSSRGVVLEALERLRAKGVSAAMVHLDHVWPFPAGAVAEMATEGRKVVTVEENYSGQLAQLLLQECGVRAAGTVRRYDGRQFTVAEVETRLGRLIAGVRNEAGA